jgi:hypothetical protein
LAMWINYYHSHNLYSILIQLFSLLSGHFRLEMAREGETIPQYKTLKFQEGRRRGK